MYNVYILQSDKTGRYYIGQTNDITARLFRHNAGRVKSTKHGIPWRVILLETFRNRSEAFRREQEIKSYKSGIKFKNLLSNQ